MDLIKLQVSLGDELNPELSFSLRGKATKSDLAGNDTVTATLKTLQYSITL
jgi:hypothetical protein